MKKWLVLSMSILLVLQQAHAAEVLRSATSGEQTLIRRYFGWNSTTCAFKLIKLDITTKPLHGKIEPRFGDHVLAPADVREGDIGPCGGKSIRVVELLYLSERGFVGKDHFTVRVLTEGLPPFTDDYEIDVK